MSFQKRAVTDSIADLLTRIRNASSAGHRYVDVLWSRMKEEIVLILKQEGFVAHYLEREGVMRIFLKYAGRKSVIAALKRVSKPGKRIYVSSREIPKVYGSMGIAILSTPKGVLVDSAARAQNQGGELLCLVW